jgi:hypothetical protein
MRAATLVLVAGSATGCAGWQVQEAAPASVVADRLPPQVRLMLTNGARVVIESPTVRNDSVIGFTRMPGAPPAVRAIAATDIARIETMETDVLRTAAVAAGLGVTILFVRSMQDFADSFSADP